MAPTPDPWSPGLPAALPGVLVAVLRTCPARALTCTELAARVSAQAAGGTGPGPRPVATADAVLAAARTLEREGVVVTARATWADPHFPAVTAVALASDGPETAATRARHCLELLERQLLRSHRCT